tara:strand:- start:799 stop:1212 length:414 start_codon:yes stop_codon:yes gene_type:complete
MVIGKIGGYLALGLVGAFLLNTLIRPASAIGTGAALTETGTGIASIGTGIGESLRSIGSGSAKLLDPLFSLKDLVYDSNVPGSANVSAAAQVEGETNNGRLTPSSNTITWSSGTTRSVPSLSPAAQSYYRSLGVKVS